MPAGEPGAREKLPCTNSETPAILSLPIWPPRVRDCWRATGPATTPSRAPGPDRAHLYFPDGQEICQCDGLAAVVSPWLYRDFVLPHMHRIADAFGGLLVHACGNPAAIPPVWGEIRGFRGFDIGATGADLPQVFRQSAGSAVIVCHVGLNSAPHFPSRLAAVEDIQKHVTPDSSLLISATSFVANMPAVSPDEWDAEFAQIVECVRAHSKQ